MKITFVFEDDSRKTSPSFAAPPDYIVEEFWDEFLGGSDDQDDDLFWCSDISGVDDEIIVEWCEDPTDPQKIIDNLALGLKTPIPPYSTWS